jgi:phage terminase small subunit
MSTLSPLQQRFIAEYLSDEKRNATAAAARAGYSDKSAKFIACHLLKNPEVQREIERRLKGIMEKLDVDAEMVVQGILETIESAKGAGQGAWQSAAVLRGYELLGRHLGMFKDKVDVRSDEQLIAALHAGRRRAAGIVDDEESVDAVSDAVGGLQGDKSKLPN